MKIASLLILIIIIATSVMGADSPFATNSVKISFGVSTASTSGDVYPHGHTVSLRPQVSICLNKGLFLGGFLLVDYYKSSKHILPNNQYIYSFEPFHTIGFSIEKYFAPNFQSSPQINDRNIYRRSIILYTKFATGFGSQDDENKTFISFSPGAIIMMGGSAGFEIGASGILDWVGGRKGQRFQVDGILSYFIF